MKILHVTPNLDGDAGMAHAAISVALPEVVQQSFVLLAPQRDPRPIEMLRAAGARVLAGAHDRRVTALAEAADIVQFEFCNDPSLIALFARCDFPAMRSMVWAHGADAVPPAVLRGLMQRSGRFAFSREAALAAAVAGIDFGAGKPVSIVDDRFTVAEPPRANGKMPAIACLGSSHCGGLHPGIFDVVDRLAGDNIRVSVWGAADAAAQAQAAAMRHPERIVFRGEIADYAVALSEADILICPFAGQTGALADTVMDEAMARAVVPVILGDGRARGCVRDSETGFLARSVDECVSVLDMLLLLPELLTKMSRTAARSIAEARTPSHAAQDLMILWLGLIGEERKRCDFRSALGRGAESVRQHRRRPAGAFAIA